jgi:chromosome segregation protein
VLGSLAGSVRCVHLKSLTLRGFKSFASATTLRLEPGITCVVGPNGSGKSNVVDALAWVMGEQGAKSLRGGKMEDVIFAGTAGRPPLGRAEVMLTIDNSDGALPIDYTEVTISRTMFRNGGSDYAINGQPCRLLDVQELLADSGIGREMHVIVGQGQLDSILHATPEDRRGFVEEAAGVLKHRKRKEKALRKLESTEGNLMRLGDLTNEIRRQLKPLGRQAEVARKAAFVQADVRDARARLLADELVTVRTALEQELADETVLLEQRAETEQRLEAARATEAELEARLRDSLPQLAQTQDTWFGLAGMRERLQAVAALAAERIRNAQTEPEVPAGRNPEELLEQAREVREQEHEIDTQVLADRAALEEALAARLAAEQAQQDEERRVTALERASADRREGLARLQGQVNAKRSRAAAAQEEVDRLTAARADALGRMERAERAFTGLETQVAGLDAGEEGLDAEHEGAAGVLRDIDERLAKAREETQATERQRTALLARQEALELGLTRKDGAGALLAASEPVSGLLGSVAALLSVRPGFEAAIAAALGAAAVAVAVDDLDAAVEAIVRLKDHDLGRAGVLTGGASEATGPELPAGVQPAVDLVDCPDALKPALRGLLSGVAVVDDLADAHRMVAQHPQVRAVTREGDLVGAHFAAGGSASAPTLLEVQAALEETTEQLGTTGHTAQRLAFELNRLEQERHEAQRSVDVALARLHESDAHLAAVAEELAQHGSQARSAKGEAERLAAAIEAAEQARDEASGGLAELEERANAAADAGGAGDEDDRRAELVEIARAARASETEARLALRTAEERARALAGRAESLERAARDEQHARARAIAHRERIRREGQVAQAVAHGARVVLERLEVSLATAAQEREQVTVARRSTEDELMQARGAMRELEGRLGDLVDSVHRDEMARTQQHMRLEQLEERALEELGLDAESLVSDYGPHLMVPVLVPDDEGVPQPGKPVPFVREEQAKRLKTAERALAVLGRVNPLALEEFSALEERHRFLTEQLEDLRRTRRDLLDIVKEVDERVEQVFTEAWHDVRVAFEHVFSRLFPGGEGRLILTDPDDMLTTGIDVEARPAGKKVKRLSLLSGGERSLVAVAFLVALFKARPSPFYILDEVEAALDDTNLGRLLEIYEELRENSQLVVITHQKRTMEIADALYGVSMRGDGVTTVISQRLREAQSA